VTLWLIGGTSESRELAIALTAWGIPWCGTVTTEAARQLYPPGATLEVGALPPEQMPAWCRRRGIRAVLDASHPFAEVVSAGAVAAATALGLPYLRFERPDLAAGAIGFDDLLAGDRLRGERVLLILGYRLLPRFRDRQHEATLFCRILPSPVALETALASGFAPERILALRPPLSAELERALWRQWRISLVVAKASGRAGGEDVKRAIAADLGIPLLCLARPRPHAGARVDTITAALDWAQRLRLHTHDPA
jgi:precorrin-6A/cobalt-precorrin-6A reductase